MNLKFLKYIFLKLGFVVRRRSATTDPMMQLQKILVDLNIDCILDIGANIGQFAVSLRQSGYDKKIISFEPLIDAHSQLVQISRNDPNWIIHERVAVGGFNGDIDINISGNSVSSSILPMMNQHMQSAIGSGYVGSENTKIYQLDTLMEGYKNSFLNSFIKIDTQGYEWEVLDGAGDLLKQAKGILCEVSLVPLYKGQKLWLEIFSRIEAMGFKLWGVQGGFTDNMTGQTLQMDMIFVKK